MQIEILTKDELLKFKAVLLAEIVALIQSQSGPDQWLRSSEVRKMLKISPATLQNLRIKGILKYRKLGGIFYYSNSEIVQAFGESKYGSWE